jgi:hypothetical protein
MDLSEGIRKIGFRRWYERQLIESHLYLISGILGLFMAMASLEGFSLRMPGWESLLRLFAMVAGAAVCLWTLRRYLMMLGMAEHAAERSVCEKCAVYKGLELSAAAPRPAAAGERVLAPVGVRCRKCGHEWTIE